MILHKETFKKFGYYPSSLPKGSHKKVFVECFECKEKRQVRYSHFVYSIKQPRCKKCLMCFMRKKRMEKFISYKKQIIYNDEFFQALAIIFDRGYVANGVIRIRLSYELTKTLFTKCNIKFTITKNDIAVSKYSLIDIIKTNSKIDIINFIKKQPKKTQFVFLNQIANLNKKVLLERKCPFQSTKSNVLLNLKQLFEINGFTCRVLNNSATCKFIRVDYGSFFIDEQWIHIG